MSAPKVTARVRQIVLERDLHSCVRCGVYLGPFSDFSIHHRRPRGMGGSRRPSTNKPANLLLLCGSGTTGCHFYIESNRSMAMEAGYLLTQQQHPDQEAVFTHRGWMLLDDEGSFVVIDGVQP